MKTRENLLIHFHGFSSAKKPILDPGHQSSGSVIREFREESKEGETPPFLFGATVIGSDPCERLDSGTAVLCPVCGQDSLPSDHVCAVPNRAKNDAVPL